MRSEKKVKVNKSNIIIRETKEKSFTLMHTEMIEKKKPPKIQIYIYIYISSQSSIIRKHYHHHVVPLARISLTLSRHFSLSFIVSGRSSGLHPVSSHSCCIYVRAGRPAFAWPYAGVHRSTLFMSSSLLLEPFN